MHGTKSGLLCATMAALNDNDLFAFNISAKAWRKILLDGAAPVPRTCLGLAESNGLLYLFGGYLNGKNFLAMYRI